MKAFILALVLVAVSILAQDERLEGTWEAIPFKAGNETVERKETLTLAPDTFERVSSGERRNGKIVFNVAHTAYSNFAIGSTAYQYKLSSDLTTLTLFELKPDTKNGSEYTKPSKQPSAVFKRQGELTESQKAIPRKSELNRTVRLLTENKSYQETIDHLKNVQKDNKRDNSFDVKQEALKKIEENNKLIEEIKKRYAFTDEEIKAAMK